VTLTRKCESCKQPITKRLYLDVHISVYKTDGPETQDAVEQTYGDYCDPCVISGAAVTDLLSSLEYKPKAAPKRARR
jgi:hypothetical protein